MKITKYTQKTESIALKKTSVRLSKDKKAELMDHLNEIRQLVKTSHKVEDIQVVFTGDKTETLIHLHKSEEK